MREVAIAMRVRCTALGVGVLLAVTARQASAQSAAPGVGQVSFANSGAPAAQQAFLTGLAQLHNFEYPAAADLFRTAQQIDPGFALAYWGEAMTYNHPIWMQQDQGSARAALGRLAPTAEARLAKAKTDRERAYLRAVETLYGAGDKPARDAAYANEMAELHRVYPDDVDGTALYALALLGSCENGRDDAVYMRAAALVEPLFPTHPQHPGIAHYLIHSYDDPAHAARGLPAARAYSTIAPNAAHAQHMCSHIFIGLGMWDEVTSANETAIAIGNKLMAATGRPPVACGHYAAWLEYGYLEQGRYADAKKVLATCYAAAAKAPAPSSGPIVDPDNARAYSFITMRLRYLLDTGEWAGDAAGWTVPAQGIHGAELTLAFTTGYAAIQRGDLTAARAEVARVDAAAQAFAGDLAKAGVTDPAPAGRSKILSAQLAGLIQMEAGAVGAALAAIRAAAAHEESLPFEFGPPFVDKPSYELLGEMLLTANQPADARDAFEKALAHTPGRTASLVGLMRAAERSGDVKKADSVKAQLQAIWHRADPGVSPRHD